jgi:hypothetical protein
VDPAADSRPVQVSLLIEDQPCGGSCPIGAVGLRAKAVEDCLLAFWSELEHHAASVVAPAVLGRPIQVPVLVEDHPSAGARPVGAVVLLTEAVKHTLGLGPRRTQQYAKNQKHQQGASLPKRGFP